MDQIAIRLKDPAGQYWAELVDPRATPRDLVPVFVDTLDLPRELQYQLVPEGRRQPLPDARSLRQSGVRAGATLIVQPVRNALLAAFGRKLYKEALDHVRDQLWDMARTRLEELYRVDPDYPDRERLWNRIGKALEAGQAGSASGVGSDAAATRPGPWRPGNAGQRPAANSAARAAASSARSAASSSASSSASSAASVAAAAGAAAGGGSFLGNLIFLAVVFVTGGAIVIYLEIVPAPDWLPPWFPLQSGSSGGGTTRINGVAVGTGDVRVTLTWNNSADLDLHVTDPTGEEIYFGNDVADSGGRLDVDANASCGSEPSVENVFWPAGRAPSGTYRVAVVRYSDCGAGPARYEVAVYVNNRLVDRHTGTLSSGSGRADLPTFRR